MKGKRTNRQQFQPSQTSWNRLLVVSCVVLCLIAIASSDEDYYKLLDVSKEASTREIRQAFKKLALTMHPDKNPVSVGLCTLTL